MAAIARRQRRFTANARAADKKRQFWSSEGSLIEENSCAPNQAAGGVSHEQANDSDEEAKSGVARSD